MELIVNYPNLLYITVPFCKNNFGNILNINDSSDDSNFEKNLIGELKRKPLIYNNKIYIKNLISIKYFDINNYFICEYLKLELIKIEYLKNNKNDFIKKVLINKNNWKLTFSFYILN